MGNTVGGAQQLLRPPVRLPVVSSSQLLHAVASVGRKNLGGKGAGLVTTCMNTVSLWPGGWWWGLAFIDFRYFSNKHPPLCLATEGNERREQRGAFGVWERKPRNRLCCLARETFASLSSSSLRFLCSQRSANTLLCILLYFTALIQSNLKVLQGLVPEFSRRELSVSLCVKTAGPLLDTGPVYPRGKF